MTLSVYTIIEERRGEEGGVVVWCGGNTLLYYCLCVCVFWETGLHFLELEHVCFLQHDDVSTTTLGPTRDEERRRMNSEQIVKITIKVTKERVI
jgi:hypothetical protein